MKLTFSLLTMALVSTLFISCSKDSPDDDTEPGNPAPQSGTTRIVTQDIEYYSGLIENTSSWATWPIAKFPVDAHAIKYSVKVLSTSKTYTWNKDASTACEYHVFASVNDIKDGIFYVGIGRTWCSGCTAVNPSWEQTYRSNIYPAGSNQVQITFYY